MSGVLRALVLLSFLYSVYAQGSCCCGDSVRGQFFYLYPPNDITLECLYDHDYGANQYREQYTGYAAAVDACPLTSSSSAGICPGCYDICHFCFSNNCAGPGTWVDKYLITGSDSNPTSSCGNARTFVRTFSEDCGTGTRTVTQNIAVVDTIPPELYIPDSMTIECVSKDGTPGFDQDGYYGGEFGSPRATDLCRNPTLSQPTPVFTGNSCTGTLTRQFSADDGCLTSSGTQVITITDTQGPEVLLLEGTLTYQCNNADIFTPPSSLYPLVYDACENYASPTTNLFSDTIYPGRCTGEYTISRVWRARDTCLIDGFSTPQIIYVIDNEPPTVTSGGSAAGFNTYTVYSCNPFPPARTFVLSDNCATSTNLYLTFEESVDGIIDYESNYDIIRDYVASDDCGNSISWTEVSHIQLTSFMNLTAAATTLAAVKGSQVLVTFNLNIANLCKTTYIVFDYGVATLNTISFTGASCSNSGAALICAYSNFPIVTSTVVPIVLTLTVPLSYQPNTLEVQASIVEGGPTTDYGFETPGRSSTLLTLS